MSKMIRIDPTRTGTLRRQFLRDINRRLAWLARQLKQLIVTDDAFGLGERKTMSFQSRVNNVIPRAYQFMTDSQKLNLFKTWLKEQVDAGVLNVGGAGQAGMPWTYQYVNSAYKKGMLRAYVDTNRAALASSPDFYMGSQAQFIKHAFGQPEILSKIQLLSTRAFDQLEGITTTVSQQLSRILAEGLAHGHGPAKIARNMQKAIGSISRTRARMIARTEIINAHAEGQLDSFQMMGVEEIGVMAEINTAGDDLVCPECSSLEGLTFTIEEARGIIPVHPNCRCAWIPSEKGAKQTGKKEELAPARFGPAQKTFDERTKTVNEYYNPLHKDSRERFIAEHEKLKKELKTYLDKRVPGWSGPLKARTYKEAVSAGKTRDLMRKQFGQAVQELTNGSHSSLKTGMHIIENGKVTNNKRVYKTVIGQFDKYFDESFANRYLQGLQTKYLKDGTTYDYMEVTRYRNQIRAFARPGLGEVHLSARESAQTVFHEFGHHAEATLGVKNKSVIWRNWRSKDNGVGDLGDLMWKSMKGEKARIDKWISPYVGKLYGDKCTEVFSMGLQNFVNESSLMSFAKKDFDHFSFIVGVINGFI